MPKTNKYLAESRHNESDCLQENSNPEVDMANEGCHAFIPNCHQLAPQVAWRWKQTFHLTHTCSDSSHTTVFWLGPPIAPCIKLSSGGCSWNDCCAMGGHYFISALWLCFVQCIFLGHISHGSPVYHRLEPESGPLLPHRGAKTALLQSPTLGKEPKSQQSNADNCKIHRKWSNESQMALQMIHKKLLVDLKLTWTQ